MANHDALDRAAQPRAAAGSPRTGPALRPARRPLGDRRLHRSRQFQDHQRHARSQCRRRVAEDRRRPHGLVPARRRYGGAHRRRRVRHPARRPAEERREHLGHDCEGAGGDRRAAGHRRPDAARFAARSAWRTIPRRQGRRHAARQCRCGHVPGQGTGPRQLPVLHARAERQGPRRTACCRRRCAAPSSATSSSCSTSRRSTCSPATSSRSRH